MHYDIDHTDRIDPRELAEERKPNILILIAFGWIIPLIIVQRIILYLVKRIGASRRSCKSRE
jgi:hypothetical protein